MRYRCLSCRRICERGEPLPLGDEHCSHEWKALPFATFLVEYPLAIFRNLLPPWECEIEEWDGEHFNATFHDEDEWKRFEEWCEGNGVEAELV